MTSFFQSVFSARMLVILILGFSSGVPFAATQGTLQAWMKDASVDLTVISLYAAVRIPYTFKFLWAPIMDYYVPPFLGRRRGWIVITQVLLVLSLAALGLSDPKSAPIQVAVCALLVCFFSASQDIILDAHRRDILADNELGMGSSIFIAGYRLGMLFAGGFAFYLADHMPWSEVYLILSGAILLGVVATLRSPEPEVEPGPRLTLQETFFGSLSNFFKRPRAWEILLFILLYKLGDNLVGAVSTYFILDIGFTKTEYFAIVKSFGLVAMIGGGFLGGAIILKIGINRALWIFGLLQAFSLLGFVVLAEVGHDQVALSTVIVLETLSIGMGTSAYAAFMASLCNRRFSATQYALLTGLMGIPSIALSAWSGALASSLGWSQYFLLCTVAAVPGFVLLFRVAPWHGAPNTDGSNDVSSLSSAPK